MSPAIFVLPTTNTLPESSLSTEELPERGELDINRRFWDLRGVQWRTDLGVLPCSSSVDDVRRATANSRRSICQVQELVYKTVGHPQYAQNYSFPSYEEGVGPSIAISFSVYETLRTYWKSQRPDDSTVMVSLSCGSLSGVASSTATFPLDLVRRRKQLEGVGGRARVYNTGLLGTLGQIMCTQGFRGLYRGILPEYYKVVPGVGIVIMTYETLKKLLSDTHF